MNVFGEINIYLKDLKNLKFQREKEDALIEVEEIKEKLEKEKTTVKIVSTLYIIQ